MVAYDISKCIQLNHIEVMSSYGTYLQGRILQAG